MKGFVSILQKLFFLPPPATVLIAIPSFTFVFYVLGMGIDGVLAYVSYGQSAYAMVITATGVIRMVRVVRGGIDDPPLVRRVRAHPLGGRYLSDAVFRAEVSFYPSLCINLLYAAMKMFSGIFYGSVWFFPGGLLFWLAVMRFLLLISTRQKRPKADLAEEYRRYRVCGVLLAVMTLALSGIVLFLVLVRQDGTYAYPGVRIYVMAIFGPFSAYDMRNR